MLNNGQMLLTMTSTKHILGVCTIQKEVLLLLLNSIKRGEEYIKTTDLPIERLQDGAW